MSSAMGRLASQCDQILRNFTTKFKSPGQILWVFLYWLYLELTLAIMLGYWRNVHYCKWPNEL